MLRSMARRAVGRSGGGLFDQQGRLIGVCNAADAEGNEGIYAAAQVVYAQINRLGLGHLFNDSAPTQTPDVQFASNSTPVQSFATASVGTRFQFAACFTAIRRASSKSCSGGLKRFADHMHHSRRERQRASCSSRIAKSRFVGRHLSTSVSGWLQVSCSRNGRARIA